MERSTAVERVEGILEAIESEPMPVPVREVWVYGDLALGLDPVERVDVYLAKDVRLRDDEAAADLEADLGVEGIGRTVSAEWARRFPEHVRANDNGYAAPAECLAAHLVRGDDPVHLEVCNAGFEENVTRRLEGARARGNYEEVLDPRGVCLWIEGRRSEDAMEKLRAGDLVFPTLPEALEMLGLDPGEAETAADAVAAYREAQEGATVRGDVV